MTSPAADIAVTAPAMAGSSLVLVEGTPVLSLRGEVAVENLRPGDRIITRAGAMPVVSVEAQRSARVALVRVSARALGHDRPEGDILLPASQPILLRDWRAQAMFGKPAATVPAGRLADGTHIRREPEAQLRLVRVTLPRAAVIYAAGLELAAEPASVTA